MSMSGKVLKEIHRLRKLAKDMQTRIEQAPRQLKIQESLAARKEEEHKQAQDAIKQMKVGIHDKEVSIKAIYGIIKKHEKQLNEAANKKEYDALQLEIKNEKESISQLEDQILQLMSDVEEKTAQLPAFDQAAKKAKGELETFRKNQDELLSRWQDELGKAQKELAQVEEGLTGDMRVMYYRIVNAKGEDALAAVNNRTCEACYTEITNQQLQNLMQGQFLVCGCGRILYLST